MAGDFVDLVAWQEAVLLVRDVFRAAHALRGPGALALADQLRRAATSIPANIAEGHGRGSRKDFVRFLNIAAASDAEVESHLMVCVAVGRLQHSEVAETLARCRRVRALIKGLARAIAVSKQPRRAVPSPIT